MPIFDQPTCRRCGYDLTGLPRQGRCPECGLVYDLDRGVGVRTAEHREQLHRLRRRRTGYLIAGGVLLVLGLGLLAVTRSLLLICLTSIVFLLALAMLLAALVSYLHEKQG